MRVTFIGLGIMGSRMAGNLLKKNVEVTVWNRSAEAMEDLVKKGARKEEKLAKSVEKADIVFSMLSTPEVVSEIFLDDSGILKHMQENTLWVDCTTVNPSFSIRSAEAAREAGVKYVDAPVAGTLPHAENAELVFFVGGEEDKLKTLDPLLNYMGKKVIYLNETGKGASFKMVVNIMLAQSMLIFSEAVVLGEAMGIDRDFLLNTIPNLVVAAPFTKFKAEMVRERKYDVQFPLEWMHKDLHLAAVTAYENNQPLYLANLTKEIYAEAVSSGLGRADFSAIHHWVEKN